MCLLLNRRRFQSYIHGCHGLCSEPESMCNTRCRSAVAQALRLGLAKPRKSLRSLGKTQEDLSRESTGKLRVIVFLSRSLTVRTRRISKCLDYFEFRQPIVLIISTILIILIIRNPRADKHTQQNSKLSFHRLPGVC